MKLLGFLWRRSRATFLLATLASVISGMATTGLLAVINAALAGETSTRALLWFFVGLCAMVPLTRLVADYLLVRLGQRAVRDLRVSLSAQILGTPLTRLEQLGPHRLLVALTADINAVTGAVTMVPLLTMNLAILVGCVAYLGWLSAPLMLVLLVIMGLSVVAYRAPQAVALARFRRARETSDELYQHFRGLTEGIKELKLHQDRRLAFQSSLGGVADRVCGENVQGAVVLNFAASIGRLLFFVILGLLLFAIPVLWPVPHETMTGYVLAVLFMMGPLQYLLNAVPTLNRSNVSVAKLEELNLSLGREETDSPALARPSSHRPDWRRIELDGVTYRHRGSDGDREFVLGPLNLDFRPGELVFLIGGNGSGKTTAAKLLTGLYEPDEGEVRLDGEAVRDGDRERLRSLFTAVFADFFLFERLLGIDQPRLDLQARRYLEKLGLSQKLDVQDGCLSTTALSQGQRKRLSLLTAYLEDRPVYLFDEWAADQDPTFKELFYFQLLPELREGGKTVLVISHDDRYYPTADRLIKFCDGQLEYDISQNPSFRRSSSP